RTSSSLPTHISTISASATAAVGVAADFPPCFSTHRVAVAGVRLYTVTVCPVRARWPAIGKPITPSPRNASSLPLILPPESRNGRSARGERGARSVDGCLDLFRRGPARLIAAGNRPLEGEDRMNIVADQRREPL